MNDAHRKASRAKRETHTQDLSASAGIDSVLKAVAIISSKRRETFMAPVRAAREMLELGEFTAKAWAELVDAMNISEALMRPGIGIAPDHAQTVEAAQLALLQLRKRRASQEQWTATEAELFALDEAIWLLDTAQLANTTNKELEQANEIVRNVVRGALTGSPGVITYVHVDDIAAQERIGAEAEKQLQRAGAPA